MSVNYVKSFIGLSHRCHITRNEAPQLGQSYYLKEAIIDIVMWLNSNVNLKLTEPGGTSKHVLCQLIN